MNSQTISTWIAIIISIATAGASWGVNSQRINELEKDMEAQKDIRQEQKRIREQQIRMEERQKQILENVEKILDKVED